MGRRARAKENREKRAVVGGGAMDREGVDKQHCRLLGKGGMGTRRRSAEKLSGVRRARAMEGGGGGGRESNGNRRDKDSLLA